MKTIYPLATSIILLTLCTANAESTWQENAANHARILSQIQWSPTADTMPNRKGGHFKKGETYTGIPYSSVRSEGRCVGFDISVRTFLAAVENPLSVLYTETLAGKVNNAAAYYGTVCSSYTSYALQCGFWEVSRRHGPKVSAGVMLIDPAVADAAQIGDVIYRPYSATSSGSHVEILTAINKDANGKILSIRVEESTPPTTRTTDRTPENFKAYLADKGRQLLRITDLNTWRRNNRADQLHFPNYQSDAAPTPVNRSLLLDLGDFVPYAKGQPVKFNIMDRDQRGLKSLIIQRGEDVIETLPLSNTGEITRHFDQCGNYSATILHADNQKSQACEFAICDHQLQLPSQAPSIGQPWQVRFSTENITPIAIYLYSDTDSYGRHPIMLAAEDQQQGQLTIPAGIIKKPGNLQVWLISEHPLGRIKLRRDLHLKP
jgi:hypothetical protein